jgi:hypothetical protein
MEQIFTKFFSWVKALCQHVCFHLSSTKFFQLRYENLLKIFNSYNTFTGIKFKTKKSTSIQLKLCGIEENIKLGGGALLLGTQPFCMLPFILIDTVECLNPGYRSADSYLSILVGHPFVQSPCVLTGFSTKLIIRTYTKRDNPLS